MKYKKFFFIIAITAITAACGMDNTSLNKSTNELYDGPPLAKKPATLTSLNSMPMRVMERSDREGESLSTSSYMSANEGGSYVSRYSEDLGVSYPIFPTSEEAAELFKAGNE